MRVLPACANCVTHRCSDCLILLRRLISHAHFYHPRPPPFPQAPFSGKPFNSAFHPLHGVLTMPGPAIGYRRVRPSSKEKKRDTNSSQKPFKCPKNQSFLRPLVGAVGWPNVRAAIKLKTNTRTTHNYGPVWRGRVETGGNQNSSSPDSATHSGNGFGEGNGDAFPLRFSCRWLRRPRTPLGNELR